jgi:hypothetical protein
MTNKVAKNSQNLQSFMTVRELMVQMIPKIILVKGEQGVDKETVE